MSVHIAIFSYAKDYEHYRMTQNAIDSVRNSLLEGTEARIVVHETAKGLIDIPAPWKPSRGTVAIDDTGRFVWNGSIHNHPTMKSCKAMVSDVMGEHTPLIVGAVSVQKTPRRAIPVSFTGHIEYNGAECIQVDEFNYAKECNRAWHDIGEAEWLLILNNDIICHKGAIEAMIATGYSSVSPISPGYDAQEGIKEPEEGYLIGRNVAGWAILTHKKVMEEIGGYDEDFPFYHVDCQYAMQLFEKNIAHCVTPEAKITHLSSKTAAGFEHKDWLKESTIKFYTKHPEEWERKTTGFHSAYWTKEEILGKEEPKPEPPKVEPKKRGRKKK